LASVVVIASPSRGASAGGVTRSVVTGTSLGGVGVSIATTASIPTLVSGVVLESLPEPESFRTLESGVPPSGPQAPSRPTSANERATREVFIVVSSIEG
jgi:hypothetical protein